MLSLDLMLYNLQAYCLAIWYSNSCLLEMHIELLSTICLAKLRLDLPTFSSRGPGPWFKSLPYLSESEPKTYGLKYLMLYGITGEPQQLALWCKGYEMQRLREELVEGRRPSQMSPTVSETWACFLWFSLKFEGFPVGL